ncbi:MAG: diguanylate cyclase [Stenotrophomonas sp.]
MSPTLPPPGEILDLLPDVVCVVDPQGHYLAVNAAFERLIGYRPEEVLGRRMTELIHPDDHATTAQAVQRVMEGRPLPHFRNRYVRRDGGLVDMQWSARWLPDYGVRIAVGHPVTELRDLERRLEFMAAHDPLTRLPNRHRLREELDRLLADGTRPLAVLYLDLDGFKAINDRHGHALGDQVLRETAAGLRQALRHGDFIARVGGDEFVALLPDCSRAEDARAVVGMLQAALDQPQAQPSFARIGVSIGVACCPADGRDAETLLRHADADMYAAKHGRGRAAGA